MGTFRQITITSATTFENLICMFKAHIIESNTTFDWLNHITNSLPKAFADYKINMNEKFEFGLGRVKNIVVTGENAEY